MDSSVVYMAIPMDCDMEIDHLTLNDERIWLFTYICIMVRGVNEGETLGEGGATPMGGTYREEVSTGTGVGT